MDGFGGQIWWMDLVDVKRGRCRKIECVKDEGRFVEEELRVRCKTDSFKMCCVTGNMVRGLC